MKFVSGILSEQITRKIIYLTLSFILAIFILGGLEHFSRKINNNFRQNLENQMSRYDLGRSIVLSLLKIELNLDTVYTAKDLRTLDIFTRKIRQDIKDIKDIIKVLRDGGVFNQELMANFYDVDSFRRKISYYPDLNNGYDLEVLNLTPKISEINDIISEIYQSKKNTISKKDIKKSEAKDKTLIMETDSLLRRSTENANKIFYEANNNIRKIKADRTEALNRLNLWSRASMIILSFTCLILFLRIIYRINFIIEERNKRLEHLKDAHNSIRIILDSLPVGVIILESDKTVKMINKAALKLLEAENINDLNYKTCADFFKAVPKDNCPICEMNHLSHNSEVNLHTVNGKEIPVIKSALPIILEGRKVLLEAFMDISEKNKAEEKVKESQQFIQALFESVPTGIAVIDADTHTIVDLNRAAVELIGSPREELINKQCHNFICPADVGQCPITDLHLDGDSSERILIKPDGRTIPVLKSVIKTDLNGRNLLIESFIDISTHKEIEKRLKEARSDADQANKAKSVFLANMSHEIRTPMNAVIGLSHLMLKTALDPKQKEFALKILTSADSLLRLLNDILDFSKIEAGKLDLEKIPLSPEKIILDAFEYIGVEAEQKGIERIIQITPEVPESIEGDPLRLRQILTNLIGNALKFTEQGEIVISCDISWSDYHTAFLTFKVSDTGIGIAADKLSKLFDSFSQADSSITRKHGGTGLGLSISKNLIELMGGTITIESEVNVGTTFMFSIKLENMPEEPDLDLQGIPPKLPVLIAHDNENLRHGTSLILKKLGLKFKTVDGEPELQKQVADKKFSAIIMDLSYGKKALSGLETAAEIMNSGKIDQSEVIITTTQTEAIAHADEIETSGIKNILTRPFSKKSLARALNAILGYPDSTFFEQEENGITEHNTLPEAEILVVEDNSINWSITKELLSSFGLKSSWAKNGKEAVRMSEQNAYDLILMDIQMPVMDGYTATNKLRLNPATRDVPIIAMTAHTMNEHRKAVVESGMNDFISKPINPDQMYSTIAKWLNSEKAPEPQADQKHGEISAPNRNVTEELHAAEFEHKEPYLDLEGALKRTGGNLEFLFSLVDDYIKRAPDYIEKINEAIESENNEQLAMEAHTLRGMAGSLGVVSLMNASSNLEEAVTNKSRKEIVQQAERLYAVYQISLGHLLLEKCLHQISLLSEQEATLVREQTLKDLNHPEDSLNIILNELEKTEITSELAQAIKDINKNIPEAALILLNNISDKLKALGE